MVRLYLYLNAVLYVVFALLCTVRARQTAEALGYALPQPHGVSEYLTVYGGLQWGLAAFFAWAAYFAQDRAGVVLALFLYGAIVAYRLASLLVLRPSATMVYGVAALEVALLIGAVVVWYAKLR